MKLFKVVLITVFAFLLYSSDHLIKVSHVYGSSECTVTGSEDCVGTFTATNYNYSPTTKILKFNSLNFTPDNSIYLPYGYRVIGIYDVTQNQISGFANDTYSNFGTCNNSGCTGAYLNNVENVTDVAQGDIIRIFEEYLTSPNPTIYLSQEIMYADLIGNPPQNISLNIPLLKQTSKIWGNQTYDSANIWNPKDSSINAWGCAITSAAMVFKYHGINKLPDNSTLDPGTLNTWLKKQNDGYIGDGLVNWLALSRLSKQSKNINNLAFDALEYSRTNGNAAQKLKDDLNNNLPGILREPGHFIVAKGINNNIFSINDPYYARTSLTDYSNSFQNLGVYTPSHTNLSYIMLVVNPNINIQLLDSNNNPAGDTFLEDAIVNPFNPYQKSGSIKIVYLQKPPEGDYKVILSSNDPSTFELKEYLYNKDGDVFIKSKSGNASSANIKTVQFHFNGQEPLYGTKATYLSTAIDIEKFRKQKLIKNDLTKAVLDDLLAKAFIQNVLKDDEKEQIFLNKLIDFLGKDEGKILEPANNMLLYDINYLGNHN